MTLQQVEMEKLERYKREAINDLFLFRVEHYQAQDNRDLKVKIALSVEAAYNNGAKPPEEWLKKRYPDRYNE